MLCCLRCLFSSFCESYCKVESQSNKPFRLFKALILLFCVVISQSNVPLRRSSLHGRRLTTVLQQWNVLIIEYTTANGMKLTRKYSSAIWKRILGQSLERGPGEGRGMGVYSTEAQTWLCLDIFLSFNTQSTVAIALTCAHDGYYVRTR
jgi:hypothetical protein